MWNLSIVHTYGEPAIWVISSQHDLPTPTHLTIITEYRSARHPPTHTHSCSAIIMMTSQSLSSYLSYNPNIFLISAGMLLSW